LSDLYLQNSNGVISTPPFPQNLSDTSTKGPVQLQMNPCAVKGYASASDIHVVGCSSNKRGDTGVYHMKTMHGLLLGCASAMFVSSYQGNTFIPA